MVAPEAPVINWSNQPSFRDLGPIQPKLFWNTVQIVSKLSSDSPIRTGRTGRTGFLKGVIRKTIVLPPVGEAPTREGIEKLIHFLETPVNPTKTAPLQE